MKLFLVILISIIIFISPLFSNEGMESLDNALKKELGIEENKDKSNKSSNTGIEKDPTNLNPAAPDPVRERYATEDSGESGFIVLLKVLLVFGGLTFVMVYILKVMAKTRNSRFPVQGKLSLLSSLPIGTNKQVQIIEVANKLLVLGVGDSSVTLLTEITDIEEKSRILKEKNEFSPTNENFLITLLEAFKDFKPNFISKKGESREFSSVESEYMDELEKKHQESLRRLQVSKKEMGLDMGGGL